MKRVSTYELSNHLGNVLTVVSDRKIAVDNNNDNIVDYFLPDIVSSTDYGCFGNPLSGRTFNRNSYPAGMNGQHKDDEIFEGAYTAEFWEYDSRLGRRWNLDPKPFVGMSDYACFLNNPVLLADPNGDIVKYDKFRDRVNAFFGRAFNKDFREKFKKWDESKDVFTLRKSQDFGKKESLTDAQVDYGAVNDGVQDNAVYYTHLGNQIPYPHFGSEDKIVQRTFNDRDNSDKVRSKTINNIYVDANHPIEVYTASYPDRVTITDQAGTVLMDKTLVDRRVTVRFRNNPGFPPMEYYDNKNPPSITNSGITSVRFSVISLDNWQPGQKDPKSDWHIDYWITKPKLKITWTK